MYTFHWSVDGDNVQAQSHLDGVLVPETTDEDTSSKRPGGEMGMWRIKT